jgi:hypothetical protein
MVETNTWKRSHSEKEIQASRQQRGASLILNDLLFYEKLKLKIIIAQNVGRGDKWG